MIINITHRYILTLYIPVAAQILIDSPPNNTVPQWQLNLYESSETDILLGKERFRPDTSTDITTQRWYIFYQLIESYSANIYLITYRNMTYIAYYVSIHSTVIL